MSRKVFMSMLGASTYGECRYASEKENFQSSKVRFVQIAMLEKNAIKWSENDYAYIFVTTGERGSLLRNWRDRVEGDNQIEGLESCIRKLNLKCQIKPVEIENGSTEKELWENLKIIYDCLKEGDQVYFEITHGFRLLPMLALVLTNYARFLKGITIKEITYGNYEAKEGDVAPIINLLALAELQDWTNATNLYLKTGRANELAALIGTDAVPSLNKFFQEISECRGIEIIKGETALQLKKELEQYRFEHILFAELISKIKEAVAPFKNDDIKNFTHAIQFCINFRMVQQGITLLLEFIITYILYEIGYNPIQKENRDSLAGCLSINKLQNFTPSDRYSEEQKENALKIAQLVFALPYKIKLTDNVYKNLSHGSRNDLNHAGMREDPKEAGYFEERLKKYYQLTMEILNISPNN